MLTKPELTPETYRLIRKLTLAGASLADVLQLTLEAAKSGARVMAAEIAAHDEAQRFERKLPDAL